MPKHCDVCQQSYPETMEHCPHCAAKAQSGGKDPGDDVIEIDWSATTAEKTGLTPAPGPATGTSPAAGTDEPGELTVRRQSKTTKLSPATRPATRIAKPEPSAEETPTDPDAGGFEGTDPKSHHPAKSRPDQTAPQFVEAEEVGPDDPDVIRQVPSQLMESDHGEGVFPVDSEEAIDIHNVPDDESGSSVRLLDKGADSAAPVEDESGEHEGVDLSESFLEEDFKRVSRGTGESSTVQLGTSPEMVFPISGDSDTAGLGVDEYHAPAKEQGAEAADGEPEEDSSGWLDRPEDAPEPTAVAESPATEAAAEEEARAVKPARRGLSPALTGGAGAAAGLLLAFGLWTFGVEPPSALRLAGGPPPKAEPVKPPGGQTVVPPSAPAADKGYQANLRNGDFDAVKAIPEPPEQDADRGQKLAARGEAKWLAYLKTNHAQLKADDPEVKQAKDDLAKSNSPEALFWLGQIQENTNESDAARKTYQDGVAKFKDKPQSKRLFQAALDRLESDLEDKGGAGKKGDDGKTGALWRLPSADLMLLLVALQADEPKEKEAPQAPKDEAKPPTAAPPAPAGDETEEAGVAFWEALKLAKQNNYKDAEKALEQAIAHHKDRRFANLRKSQNPTSDPTEQIFLSCCKELQAYWKLREKLVDEHYLEGGKTDVAKALDTVLKEAKEKASGGKATQALAEKLKADKDVAAADPEIKDVAKGLDVLLQAKKKNEEQLAAVKTGLEQGKYINDTQKDLGEGLKKLLKDKKEAGEALDAATALLITAKYVSEDSPSVSDGVKKLLADKKATEDKLMQADTKLKAADGTLQAVAGKLAEAKLVAPDARGNALVKGLDRAIKEAASPLVSALARVANEVSNSGNEVASRMVPTYDLASALAASRMQIAQYQLELKQARTAQQILPLWVPALESKEGKTIAERAIRDARQVLQGPGDAEAKAQAQYVLGLALRDEGKMDEARQALEEAVKGKATAKDGWRAAARQALNEVKDPGANYLPQMVRDLAQREGKWTAALQEYAQNVNKTNLPTDYADSLRYLIENHPAFRIPDVLKAPNPQAAESFYTLGLQNYYSGLYREAERDFAQSVRYAGKEGQDARTLYFLGLTQYLQGRRNEAQESFRQGKIREQLNRPPSQTVNEALERVQGDLRRVLNDQRP
jgi:TolA-binding protein